MLHLEIREARERLQALHDRTNDAICTTPDILKAFAEFAESGLAELIESLEEFEDEVEVLEEKLEKLEKK